ncbi:MAG: Fic family protein [Candidatus Taylorbacteria bacterium]|nr:Fic family protein [Candidatus Taylorbacteria bacterium]
MVHLNRRQNKTIEILLKRRNARSSDVHRDLTAAGDAISLVTAKRVLSELLSFGALTTLGSGRSTAYSVSAYGRLIFDVDAHEYCAADPDKRHGATGYNFGLFDALSFDPFTAEEHAQFDTITRAYALRTRDLPPAILEKELERFIIELSWKSSRIEGNTYTLLDTERLIARGIEAPGHDRNEAVMILNHKEAFKFVRKQAGSFSKLTRQNLEEVHRLLVKDMAVNYGLRSKPVGVIGSTYRPLDNIHQIKEAVDALCRAVSRIQSPQGKALVALLGLSYTQPFEDGNKRTARLIANALLLAGGCAPLSYRSVDENAYREAMLVFYELNSLIPFKKIFVEQYCFAAETYLVSL